MWLALALFASTALALGTPTCAAAQLALAASSTPSRSVEFDERSFAELERLANDLAAESQHVVRPVAEVIDWRPSLTPWFPESGKGTWVRYAFATRFGSTGSAEEVWGPYGLIRIDLREGVPRFTLLTSTPASVGLQGIRPVMASEVLSFPVGEARDRAADAQGPWLPRLVAYYRRWARNNGIQAAQVRSIAPQLLPPESLR